MGTGRSRCNWLVRLITTHKEFGSGSHLLSWRDGHFRLPKMAAFLRTGNRLPDEVVLYAATNWTMGIGLAAATISRHIQ
jgi:hypothetical protein